MVCAQNVKEWIFFFFLIICFKRLLKKFDNCNVLTIFFGMEIISLKNKRCWLSHVGHNFLSNRLSYDGLGFFFRN